MKIGLWLLEKGSVRFAVLLSPTGKFGQITGLKFQVGTPNSPDGTQITFQSQLRDLHWKPADGSSQAEPLLTDPSRLWPGSWSPDGQTLAFMKTNPTTGDDIHVNGGDRGRVANESE